MSVMQRIRSQDGWEKAFSILVLVLLIIVFATFRDYGVSWDDEFSRIQGADYIRWWISGFQAKEILSTVTSEYIYGALFSAPAFAISYVLPFGKYEGIHLMIAFAGLIGVLMAFLSARRLAGSRAGFFAALILALTPAYYGHSFINPKDIPVAALYMVSVYALLVLYDHFPRPGTKRIVITGLALALPISVRVASIMVFGYAVIVAAAWIIAQRLKASSSRSVSGGDVGRIAVAIVGMWAVAWIVMVFWWPFAQVNPIMNPIHAIVRSATFNGANFTNLFRGEYIYSSNLPRQYLPVLLGVTLPEFYFAGFIAFIVAAARGISRRADDIAIDPLAKLGFFVFVALFPITVAVVLRPLVYDSTRLFLFVMPPLAVITAIGLNWFFALRVSTLVKGAVAALLVMDAGFVVSDMAALHPYQYAFFNRASGGVPHAYRRFDVEYWGTSYKEGIDWLARNYKPGAPPQSISVANPSNPFLTYYYLNTSKPEVQRFKPVDSASRADVVLSLPRWNQHLVYGRRLLHIVERKGVPFLYIFEASASHYSQDSTMRWGINRLFNGRDPRSAESDFRKVLSVEPDHYGALQALAIDLDETGRSSEARPVWQKVLSMAREYHDARTAELAMERIASSR